MSKQAAGILRPCPVCGGTESETIYQHTLVLFEDHPLFTEHGFGVCGCCGMGFNQTVATADVYETYYKEMSKYATSCSPMAGADKFSKLADILSRIFPDKDTAILDVGCGAGGFLAKLREYGYKNLSGMDPSPACVEGVIRALNIDARVGVLAEPPFPFGGFELVISTGVMEHLLHPAQDLAGFRKLLAPGGAAFVAVPDASRYVEFLDAPFQDFNIEHLNHFSPQTLGGLFSRQGWHEAVLGQDVLPKTPQWSEPIAWGLFKPGREGGKDLPVPGFDAALGTALKEYVTRSAALLAKMDQHLRRELADASEVMLWGSGQTASLLLSSTVLREKKIYAVVDSNPAYADRRLAGARVGGPNLRGDFSGPVVVGTIREGRAVETIIRETLKWDNPIITL